MRNPKKKFQKSSVHSSKVMLCIKKCDERTDGRKEGRTDEQPRSNMPPPPPQLLSWGHKKHTKQKTTQQNKNQLNKQTRKSVKPKDARRRFTVMEELC